MKITRFETFLANGGLRNYLFIRLTTDTGLTGIGEASLEWQEKTVQTLAHEWVERRVLGRDPFDIEAVVGNLVRDQYQGGATVMTAISGVEIALWDLVGKACGQPVYRLLGGRCHERLPAYANGWYGGARTPHEFAGRAREAVGRGYRALKFDPFGTAVQDLRIAPHCSVGPVALAACLHVDLSTPNFMIQEAFAEFDVPWRASLVRGWNPIKNGEFVPDDAPGLGLELDEDVVRAHPYV